MLADGLMNSGGGMMNAIPPNSRCAVPPAVTAASADADRSSAAWESTAALAAPPAVRVRLPEPPVAPLAVPVPTSVRDAVPLPVGARFPDPLRERLPDPDATRVAAPEADSEIDA